LIPGYLSSSGAAVLTIALALLRSLRAWLRAHPELGLENRALRHQLTVRQRQVRQPRLKGRERVFWGVLKRAWPDGRSALRILQPETVIAWPRAGFRMFWRWKSRRRRGRPATAPELVGLLRQMGAANPTWGSPRIRDELGSMPRRLRFGNSGPLPDADLPKTGGPFWVTTPGPLPPWTASWSRQ